MSKKLGTLTLDLIAKIGKFTGPMKDAEKQSKSTFEEIKRGAEQVKKSMPAMAAATVAALGTITTSHVHAANEIAKLSAVADTNVVAFQEQAVGARAVGVEYDKYADIVKDVNEKLGEFAENGGGGAKDFFDDIAPKIGVTIEQFQRLSGSEALQLYKDSLDKANVSQKSQIFYLESLASDAKNLMPLLANGGKGFDAYADSIRRSGAVMSAEAIGKAQTLTAVKGELSNQLKGLKNQIGQAVVPTLIEMGTAIAGAGDKGEIFQHIGAGVHAVVSTIARVVLGAATSFKVLGKGIALVVGSIAEFKRGGFSAAKNFAAVGLEDINHTLSQAADQQERLKSAAGETTKEIQTMASVLSQQGRYANSSGLAAHTIAVNTKKAAQAAKAHESAVRRANTALTQQQRIAGQIAQQAKAAREARRDAFNEIVRASLPENNRIKRQLKDRIKLINEFAKKGTFAHKHLSQYVKAEANEQRVNFIANEARKLLKFKAYSMSAIDVTKARYQIEKAEIEATTRKAKERAYILRHMRNDAKNQIALLQLAEDRKLASFTSHEKTKLQLIRQRYEFERKQLELNKKITDPKAKGKRLDAINSKENHEIEQLQTSQRQAYELQGHVLNGTESDYNLDKQKQDQIKQLDKWRQNEVISAEEHAARLLEIDRQYYAKKSQIQIGQMGSIAGSLSSITKNIFGKQSKAYRAMIVAEKAASIARSMIAIQTGVALAAANPFPLNLGAMASVAAATANIVGQIKSVKEPSLKGYQGGGYTGNIGVNQVAGLVHGQEFVTPAPQTKIYRRELEEMKAGTFKRNEGVVNINITNLDSGSVDVQASQNSDGDIEITVQRIIDRYIPVQMRLPNSPLMRSIVDNTTANRKRS